MDLTHSAREREGLIFSTVLQIHKLKSVMGQTQPAMCFVRSAHKCGINPTLSSVSSDSNEPVCP